MYKTITMGENFGRINIKLKPIMDAKKISISEMSKYACVKYDVVKRYYYGDLYLVDLQTLAKFCFVLNKDVSEILEYDNSKTLEKQKVYINF